MKYPLANKNVIVYSTIIFPTQVMQSQWAWVLQLTLCLETHLKHTTQYHNFFEEVKEAEKWIQK